jgi:hypothetical protein
VPITSAPVDPARFTSLLFMACQPKIDRDTQIQHTTKDGSSRKWTVVVAAIKPASYDPAQLENGTLNVTVTSVDNPADGMAPGTPVTFVDFTTGVMKPEAGEGGKIRGGSLFWSATGIRALVGKS